MSRKMTIPKEEEEDKEAEASTEEEVNPEEEVNIEEEVRVKEELTEASEVLEEAEVRDQREETWLVTKSRPLSNPPQSSKRPKSESSEHLIDLINV